LFFESFSEIKKPLFFEFFFVFIIFFLFYLFYFVVIQNHGGYVHWRRILEP